MIMFEKKLGNLGRKIDLIIDKVASWNRVMPWYKVKAYLFTKRIIKNNDFKSDEHFYKFMENLRNFNYLWSWQHRRLFKFYKANKKVSKHG